VDKLTDKQLDKLTIRQVDQLDDAEASNSSTRQLVNSSTAEADLSSEEYYNQGNAFRKQGNWQEAINCYIKAIELDPESPAVEAKRMLDDILDFYNKDMYNP